jgi:Flp pilus assembly pilin Flp
VNIVYRAVSTRVVGSGGDEGQALVEYALILLFVALVAITALAAVGGALQPMIQAVIDISGI